MLTLVHFGIEAEQHQRIRQNQRALGRISEDNSCSPRLGYFDLLD